MTSFQSGTYIVRCGTVFYVGSSTNLLSRRRGHNWELRRGFHSNEKLQKAFNESGDFQFTPVDHIDRCAGEPDEAFRKRLRDAEQQLLDFYAMDTGLANKSRSAFGPDNGDLLRKRWEDPRYRKLMSDHMKGRVFSEETKRKMSKAKQGVGNPKARSVEVDCPDGTKKHFPTVTDAAGFFGVSQQLMDQWLKGITAWPGTGVKAPRVKNRWIADYSARMM